MPVMVVSFIIVFTGYSGFRDPITISHVYGSNVTGSNEISLVEKINFSTPITIAEGEVYGPTTAIDPESGMIYVANIQTENNLTDLYLRKSVDGGKTFSEPVRVNDKEGDVTFIGSAPPHMKVGPDGEVYVLWTKSESSPQIEAAGFEWGVASLRFAYSKDGGETFSPAVNIAQNEPLADRNFESFTVSPNGTIYVGWLDLQGMGATDGSPVKVARSIDGGRTFEPSAVVADSRPVCPCCSVNLASDSDNSLYVSWRKVFNVPPGEDPDSALGPRDMVIARSTNGGHSFSVPHKISDDNFLVNQCVHVGAPLAFDSKGNLHVVWYTGKEGAPGIYYAVSSDKGQTFGKLIPIFVSEFVPPTRPEITVDGQDNVYVTWEDALGQSANPEHWEYEETQASIQVALVTPEGNVVKPDKAVYEGNNRLPIIAAGKDQIALVWGGDDAVYFTSSSSSDTPD